MIKSLKDRLETIGVLVGLIAVLGGFVFWAGQPPYASQYETALRFLGFELRYLEQRLDSLARRIFELEMAKERYRKSGQGFPVIMERELQRLKRLQEIENKKIDQLIKKGKR